MAATGIFARFFKVFLSHYCSESMVIPDSFYAQLPNPLPKTAILRGTGGCLWKMEMITRQGDVYFGQGWSKFVEDNRLTDGDFLTFIYDGYRTFEVSTYGIGGCKETRVFAQVIDVSEDSSSDTDTDSETEMVNTIHTPSESEPEIVNTNHTPSEPEMVSTNHTPSEPEMMNTNQNHTPSEPEMVNTNHTTSEPEMVNTNHTPLEPEMVNSNRVSRRNKGKSREVVVEYSDEDSDSFYFTDSSEEDRTAFIELNAKNSRNKGKSKLVNDVEAATCSHSVTKRTKKGKFKLLKDLEATTCSHSVAKKTREPKTKRKIQNPEAYMDDPSNLYVETTLKNRNYELVIGGQLVRDYGLEFADNLEYRDDHGKLPTRATKWADRRPSIKKWNSICARNRIKKEDCVLCELLRNQNVVYAIKIHIIRGANV